MTRVWRNGSGVDARSQVTQSNDGQMGDQAETTFGSKEAPEGHGNDKVKDDDEKLHYLNGNEKNFKNMKNGTKKGDTNVEEENSDKAAFLGIKFDKDLEKELAEQSMLMLKMIYFFQVLPFYILQFTSGMALGKNLQLYLSHYPNEQNSL